MQEPQSATTPGAAPRFVPADAELPPPRARARRISRADRGAPAPRLRRTDAEGDLPRIRRQPGAPRHAGRRPRPGARSVFDRLPAGDRDPAHSRCRAARPTGARRGAAARDVHDGLRDRVRLSGGLSCLLRGAGVHFVTLAGKYDTSAAKSRRFRVVVGSHPAVTKTAAAAADEAARTAGHGQRGTRATARGEHDHGESSDDSRPSGGGGTRQQTHEIVIDAPIEAVWKAITDGEELTRWFVEEATVEPGVGGTITISWGGGDEGESRIEAWEPNQTPAPRSQVRPRQRRRHRLGIHDRTTWREDGT